MSIQTAATDSPIISVLSPDPKFKLALKPKESQEGSEKYMKLIFQVAIF